MKLFRYGKQGEEKPGIEINGIKKDVSAFVHDYDRKFFNNDGLSQLAQIIEKEQLPTIEDNERIGAPVARPGKVLCIGLNYSDHAKESGMEIPKEPILFQKGANTVVGPNDHIIIPRGSEKTDWEVELGVIIGKMRGTFLPQKRHSNT
jgi:2,4-didehydro-3-deoxy-L-rhamnonate hydrolase